MLLYLLPPMDRVFLLLLSSTFFPPLPLFKLFLSSSLVTAIDDEDDEDVVNYEDQYDIASDASLFVGFRNQFLSYHLIS